MAVLDTLSILIEADSRGLEAQLKKSGDNIVNFVSQLNKQEVNWTQILSRTISPAIISGIASMFATAMVSATAFNDQVTKQGEAAGMTGSQIQQFGADLKNISVATGVTDLTNLGSAYSLLYNVLGQNSEATKSVVNDLAQLQQAGFGTASSIATALLPVMQAWGVTTEEQANVVMKAFMNAAEASGQSISTLAGAFGGLQAGFIAGGASLKDLNNLVLTFGANVGVLGLDSTTERFKIFSKAVSGAADSLGLAGALGGVNNLRDAVTSGNVEKGLDQIAEKATKMSVIVANAFGIDETAYSHLKIALEKMPQTDAATNKVITNQKDILTAFDNSATAVREFQILLAKFETSSKDWGTVLLEGLNTFLKSFTTEGMKPITDLLKGNIGATDPTRAGLGNIMSGMKTSAQTSSQGTTNTTYVSAPITVNAGTGESTVTANKISTTLYNEFQK